MVVRGYWNDPVRSEQCFQDNWFVTSDLFSVDSNGCLYIHGRADHLIKLGCGDWVNPIELEMVLLQNPTVRECAIVGAPDSTGLTVLRAVVVLDVAVMPGPALAVELAEMIRDRWPLQHFKRVDTVEFAAALPKTTAGKLDRAKLQPQSMTEFSYKC
jgi:acyl-coenzyme A synthetase/AMP-(fatty) acid ligase